jgi:hypothetical protein
MDMWTAPSDRDYYEGDLPPEDRPFEERDPEYEVWLEQHGYLDPPSDTDLELMRVEHEQRHTVRAHCSDCGNPDCPKVDPTPYWRRCPAESRVGVVDDDIPF